MKRLAYLVVAGVLTSLGLLFSGELFGRNEQARIMAAVVEPPAETPATIPVSTQPARQVRVVLPAPFEATP